MPVARLLVPPRVAAVGSPVDPVNPGRTLERRRDGGVVVQAAGGAPRALVKGELLDQAPPAAVDVRIDVERHERNGADPVAHVERQRVRDGKRKWRTGRSGDTSRREDRHAQTLGSVRIPVARHAVPVHPHAGVRVEPPHIRVGEVLERDDQRLLVAGTHGQAHRAASGTTQNRLKRFRVDLGRVGKGPVCIACVVVREHTHTSGRRIRLHPRRERSNLLREGPSRPVRSHRSQHTRERSRSERRGRRMPSTSLLL